MIDTHSHILPGIDDGARELADSVRLVRELVSQGVTDIIATPHFANETIYVSPRAENLKIMNSLKEKLVDEGVDVNIYLGNEIYIDNKILELLKFGAIATLADSKYLLVELPLNGEYPNYEDLLAELMQNGYKVILAHPERYEITQNDYSVIDDLCNIGVLLQCNTGSIVGKYGKKAKKLVEKLAKDKLIFVFGSDIHHCRGGEDLKMAQKKLRKYYSEDELNQVLVKNPKKILET